MVDFSQHILRKSEALVAKAALLPKITYHWQPPVIINCNEINQYDKGVNPASFDSLLEKRNLPALYYFKVVSLGDRQEIINKLELFKSKKTHSCPQIKRKRSIDSSILYCGSVRKNLHGRLVQHLGKGHHLTYSLQLLHWACEGDLKLEYHYAWLDKEDHGYTELLESALAEHLSPLVGKIEI
jgi:hypothetical protein